MAGGCAGRPRWAVLLGTSPDQRAPAAWRVGAEGALVPSCWICLGSPGRGGLSSISTAPEVSEHRHAEGRRRGRHEKSSSGDWACRDGAPGRPSPLRPAACSGAFRGATPGSSPEALSAGVGPAWASGRAWAPGDGQQVSPRSSGVGGRTLIPARFSASDAGPWGPGTKARGVGQRLEPPGHGQGRHVGTRAARERASTDVADNLTVLEQ